MCACLLLYNPTAGRNRLHREALVLRIASRLQSFGYEPQVVATIHRGSAADQVRAAIADGAQVVFVCGGDGTVHDALQGIVGTDVPLAIIPLGSANALCRELGIPRQATMAVEAYAHADERTMPVSACTVAGEERFFLTMAGAGPDGALMYRMLTADRARWGRWVYAWHALHLLFRKRFHTFPIEYLDAKTGTWSRTIAVSAMGLRIASLGGVFPGVARGASLRSGVLRLVIVKRPASMGLPLWFLMNWLGLERWNPLLLSLDVSAFRCGAAESPVHAQADGEWIGRLPMKVVGNHRTIRMLIPRVALSREQHAALH